MEDAIKSKVYIEETRKQGVILDLFSIQNQSEAQQLGARDQQLLSNLERWLYLIEDAMKIHSSGSEAYMEGRRRK